MLSLTSSNLPAIADQPRSLYQATLIDGILKTVQAPTLRGVIAQITASTDFAAAFPNYEAGFLTIVRQTRSETTDNGVPRLASLGRVGRSTPSASEPLRSQLHQECSAGRELRPTSELVVPPEEYCVAEGSQRTLLLPDQVALHWAPVQPYHYFAISLEHELIYEGERLDVLLGQLHRRGCSRVHLDRFHVYACLAPRSVKRPFVPSDNPSAFRAASFQELLRQEWLELVKPRHFSLHLRRPDDDIAEVPWQEYVDASSFDASAYGTPLPGLARWAHTCPLCAEKLPLRQPPMAVALLPAARMAIHSTGADGARRPLI